LSINPQYLSYGLLKQSRAFSVNVLKKGQLELAAHFGGPARADKLALTEWTTGRTGVPLLREALAWFECQLVGELPAGDHVLMLGNVIDGKLLRSARARLVRDGRVVWEGKIASLRRFKDDAREVLSGYECGLGLENFNDLKPGDIVEDFEMEAVLRKLGAPRADASRGGGAGAEKQLQP